MSRVVEIKREIEFIIVNQSLFTYTNVFISDKIQVRFLVNALRVASVLFVPACDE